MLFSLSDGDGVNRAGVRTKAHVRACNVAPDVRIQQNSGSDSCPPAAGDANVSRSSSPAGNDVVPLFTSFVLQRAKVVINVSKCKVGVSLSVLKVGGSLLFFFTWPACWACQPFGNFCQPSCSSCSCGSFSCCPVGGRGGLAPLRRGTKKARSKRNAPSERGTLRVERYFTTTFLP